MFTALKFDPASISEFAARAAANLAEAMPSENPLAFAAKTVSARLKATPGAYVQFGPYWWAVKAALRGAGHNFGAAGDDVVLAEYGGAMPAYSALVAGEQFRDYYRENMLVGSNTFDLGAEAQGDYILFDPDMESRRVGGGMLGSGVSEADLSEPDQPILDDVRVKFEEGAELWTATVSGLEAGPAADRVAELQSSGAVGRAIDMAKGIRFAVLDSVAAGITVDLAGKAIHISGR